MSEQNELSHGEADMSYERPHNAMLDYGRLLAVIGIIWFHTKAPGGSIGYSGLAFFLLILIVLALPQIQHTRALRHRAPAALRYAAARAQRLLVPWVIASALYGVLKLGEVSQGAALDTEFTTVMWITGTASHLWFLPFAFAMCLALWPLGRWLTTLDDTHALPLSLGLLACALAALWANQDSTLSLPFAQWAYALPAVLLGAAFAVMRGQPLQVLGLAALFICTALSARWTAGLLQLTLASGALVVCLLVPLRPSPMSAFAARAAFAAYLIHPAVITLLVRSGFVPAQSITLAVATTVISIGIVAIWETMRLRASFPGAHA